MAELPVVLLPVGVDDDALDACLAALEAGTPAGTRVWLADDAQAGPRGLAIIERWLQKTRRRPITRVALDRRGRAPDEALAPAATRNAVLVPDAVCRRPLGRALRPASRAM